MIWFTHSNSQLENLLQGIQVDDYVKDEILAIDFEEVFINNKITFAVLADEDVSIFYTLLEVSSFVDYVTDDLVRIVVDDLEALMFDGKDIIFIFVKTNQSEEADELINSLL